MKKVALIFILAVMAPSLALAWLAVGSLKDQQIVLERQRVLLYEGVCDGVVKDMVEQFGAVQRDFGRVVESILATYKPRDAAYVFDEQLVRRWPLADVGFSVSLDGVIFAPSLLGRGDARRFRVENDLFLSNRESVEFYWNSPKGAINLSRIDEAQNVNPAQNRAVVPQQEGLPVNNLKGYSKLFPSETEFRKIVAEDPEGALARYLQNKLKLLIWYRSPNETNVVFGAQLDLERLLSQLRPLLRLDEPLQREICLALLNDTGLPAGSTKPEFQTDWKRPFVSVEIGEMLPHWEVAAYLLNPEMLSQSAQTLSLTLGLLIALLVVAIGIGGWLIVFDLKRELTLARQKTDFVGNVSHELKTPLTSIRMFSELLAEGRVADSGKQREYLRIITAETARLTRLINNVLDFSRMERGEKQYRFEDRDLVELVRNTLESYRPQLESAGFRVTFRAVPGRAVVRCDADALSQVVLNLLSNAEKYSGERKEIEVEIASSSGEVEVRVSDCGLGVPGAAKDKIFEQFYRGHDALNSGIQGSGLGLTLSRQIARAHKGDVLYEPREGGGSTFTLRVPEQAYETENPHR